MILPYIEYINFNKSLEGLIPVIIQDFGTLKVLMLGYMNEETYQFSIQNKKVYFFSRSKKREWMKGEENKHHLIIKEIFIDCDRDSLLIKAAPMGPTCHKGTDSCWGDINKESFEVLRKIEKIIFFKRNLEIKIHKSYVKNISNRGINKIIQKVGEEVIELLLESKDNNKKLFINEAADLLFHYLILLQVKNFKLHDIVSILKKRNK